MYVCARDVTGVSAGLIGWEGAPGGWTNGRKGGGGIICGVLTLKYLSLIL